jgi:hypothetical protein
VTLIRGTRRLTMAGAPLHDSLHDRAGQRHERSHCFSRCDRLHRATAGAVVNDTHLHDAVRRGLVLTIRASGVHVASLSQDRLRRRQLPFSVC